MTNTLPLYVGARFRIMTSNCLFNFSAESRAPILAENYLYYRPDLLGLQEVNSTLHRSLIPIMLENGYGLVSARPDPDKRSEEELQSLSSKYSTINFFPILFNKNRFDEVRSGFFMYRSTFTYTKGVTWAVLREKDTGLMAGHINTHCALVLKNYGLNRSDSDLGAEWREDNARQLSDTADQIRAEYGKLPIFITGDFNGHENTKYYNYITSHGFKNSKYAATGTSVHHLSTFHRTPGAAPSSGSDQLPIDHIFVAGENVRVFSHSIELRQRALDASDHCIVFADINFE